jgi:hypothetical protein
VTRVLDAGALLLTAAALIAAGIALAASRRPRAALSVLLDLLTAAGLLRLAAEPDWHRLLTAAAVVALRHVIVLGFHSPDPPGPVRLSRGQVAVVRGGTGGRRRRE